MKIKNKLTILLGFLLLSIIFWNKFIRIRLPKNLEVFSNKILFIFIILSIIFCITILLENLKLIYKKNNIKENTVVNILIDELAKNPYIQLLANWFIYIIESPKKFYEYFFQKINVVYLVEKPLLFLIKHGKIKIYIYIIGYMLPKCILSIIFLVDICYFKELNYFYKSLPILVIPLILTGYRYIANNLAEKNLTFFCAHIIFIHNPIDKSITLNFEKEIPKIEDAIDIIKHKDKQNFFNGLQIILISIQI